MHIDDVHILSISILKQNHIKIYSYSVGNCKEFEKYVLKCN